MNHMGKGALCSITRGKKTTAQRLLHNGSIHEQSYFSNVLAMYQIFSLNLKEVHCTQYLITVKLNRVLCTEDGWC